MCAPEQSRSITYVVTRNSNSIPGEFLGSLDERRSASAEGAGGEGYCECHAGSIAQHPRNGNLLCLPDLCVNGESCPSPPPPFPALFAFFGQGEGRRSFPEVFPTN